ncbi:MAG: fumarate hydratase, partial [Prevotella sp.]|nr:fumarate hydratase [Prevotella sp.]
MEMAEKEDLVPGKGAIVGDDVVVSINKGVSNGYIKHYLRKSIVCDPLNRVNTKD